MTIFETIGMAWVILTSLLASIAIMYLAYIGFRVVVTSGVSVVQVTGEDKAAADKTMQDIVDEIQRNDKMVLKMQQVLRK